jgi:nucleoid-associated protein YgaU
MRATMLFFLIIMLCGAAFSYNFQAGTKAKLEQAFASFNEGEFALASAQFQEIRDTQGLGAEENAVLDDYIQRANRADFLTNALVALYTEPTAPSQVNRAEGGFIHIVHSGECLWDIAGYKTYYRDPHRWHEIYNANKDIINPDDKPYPGWWIYPGQELFIPMPTNRPYSSYEEGKKLQEGKK